MKYLNKGRALGLLGIFIALIGLGSYFYYQYQLSQDLKNLTEVKQFKTEQELSRYQFLVREADKRDTYGSTTPEGTLQLFIEALKKGDAELASKYFVPIKQKDILIALKNGMNSGGVASLISDISQEKNKACDNTIGKCVFTTSDKSNRAEFSFVLVLNEYSKIWKIEEL